jgi:chromosome segregation ATPase
MTDRREEKEMADQRDNVLEYLRYIREGVDDLKVAVSSTRHRVGTVEQAAVGVRQDLTAVEDSIVRLGIRLDGMEEQLNRIEKAVGAKP